MEFLSWSLAAETHGGHPQAPQRFSSHCLGFLCFHCRLSKAQQMSMIIGQDLCSDPPGTPKSEDSCAQCCLADTLHTASLSSWPLPRFQEFLLLVSRCVPPPLVATYVQGWLILPPKQLLNLGLCRHLQSHTWASCKTSSEQLQQLLS